MKSARIPPTTYWFAVAAAIGLLTLVAPAFGKDQEKDEKLLLMGVVSQIEADNLLIRNPSEKKPDRKLRLTKETKFAFARIIHGPLQKMTPCRRASGVSRMVYFQRQQNHPAHAGRSP